jgi:hypothetical protein
LEQAVKQKEEQSAARGAEIRKLKAAREEQTLKLPRTRIKQKERNQFMEKAFERAKKLGQMNQFPRR